ncbi:MAG TPA: BTAD domain-containing putative transcriptional regulator, partial [Candidatus Limnocylindrales bacterium]
NAETDPWTSGLAALLRGWLRPDETGAFETLGAAAEQFAGLGSVALEGWARSLQALVAARAGSPGAGQSIADAEAAIRRGSVPEARFLLEAALACTDLERADYHRARSVEIRRRTGLVEPPAAAEARREDPAARQSGGTNEARPAPRPERVRREAAPVAAGAVSIELFGGFCLRVDGLEVDLSTVKPRARLVLHLLGLNGGAPVHREAFLAALWPDADPETAARLLHVAISSLRTVLEPGTARGGAGLVRRDGDAYRLGLPAGSEIDLVAFEVLLASAAASRAAGEDEAAADALRRALERYRGDLLPEDGPAEWLVEARDRARLAAVGAARDLADLRLRAGDHAGAIQACLRGLAVDRYDDASWRLLVEAHDRAGDRSAAHRARRGYEQMLTDLGIDPATEAIRVPAAAGYAGAISTGA